MNLNFKRVNSFSSSIVYILIFLEITGLSFGLNWTQNYDDDLIVTQPGPEVSESEQEVQASNCQQQYLELKNELKSVQEALESYKESQLEVVYFVPQRIEMIVQAIVENREDVLVKQMNFIQEHILDDQLIKKISEQILFSILRDSTVTTIFQRLSLITTICPQKFQLELVEFLFDRLDFSGFLKNLENLQKTVKLISQIFIEIKSNNTNYQKSLLTSSWTKDSEVKLLHRLTLNLLSLSEDSEDNDNMVWTNASRWLNAEFFSTFLLLSEEEIYQEMLDTFETHFEDKVLLSKGQLEYFKKLYYYSFLMTSNNLSNMVLVSAIRSNLINHKEWPRRKQIFARALIFNSIDRDILSRVTTNSTDATTIGLNYLKDELYDELFGYYGFNENDIWFTHIVEIFLHAMQSGTLTYDPKERDFWKMINYFGYAKNLLSKYSFLDDDVKSLIFDLYEHKPENLEIVIKFIKVIPRELALVGVQQILSLMREDDSLTNGYQAFLVADFMLASNLQNNSIWNEIPEQIRLLYDYSSEKRLLWFTTIGEIKYQVYVNDEFSIRLKSLSHDSTDQDEQEQQQMLNETIKNVWTFDSTLNLYKPFIDPVRTHISLFETLPSHGGVVVATDDENQVLRHVVNFRDRKNGKYALFKPVLSGESFQLHFGDQFVSILHSADNHPIGLMLQSELEFSANFTLQRI